MFPVGIKKQSRGFTLIELLVVIGLIAVLIATTLTIVPKVRRSVQAAQTSSQLSAIAAAIQMYYADFHAYPGPLANNQLNWSYDAVAANQPGMYGPNPSGTGTIFYPLQPISPPPFSNPAYNPPPGPQFSYKITGAQNLVLGLCGGLELQYNSGVLTNFIYNPLDLLASDGVTPSPRGPASLNLSTPRRQQSYLQLRAGDLSVPNVNANGGTGTGFLDDAGRAPNDAMIPVFLDKFGQPLPILYYRTNVGAPAIAGFRNTNGTATSLGTQLQDVNGNNVTAQYDLAQNIAYTNSGIGLTGNNMNSIHGLKGLGNANLTDPIDTNVGGTNLPANNGSNGLAYFKDPSLNIPNTSTNTYQGVARQKDGYILISAGPDRQYGTRDDIIYPGPLQP